MFDPLSPELIGNPYPYYDRLRADDPVHSSPLGFYVLSRHADVSSVLRDKRFGKDFVGQVTRRHGAQILDEPIYRSMRHWIADAESARSHPAAWLGASRTSEHSSVGAAKRRESVRMFG
jgi:cytochrome P450